MTMNKLWQIRYAMENQVANDPANQFWQSFALNIFGICSDGKVHERIYYHLIERAQVPVLILTGDVPLFPMRKINVVTCLIDDLDRYVISRLSGGIAQFEVVSGCGHLLLDNAKEKCRSIIGKFCDTALSHSSHRP